MAASAMKRQMSSQVAILQKDAENHHLNRKNKMSPKDMSDYMVRTQKAEAAKNKEYYDMLNDVDARQRFFQALSEENSSDHSAIKTVKSKIASLIKHEIAEMGFKNQLSQEE